MPIDRRTFVLSGGVAAAGAALASFGALAAMYPEDGPVPALATTSKADIASTSAFELRIAGWDRSDEHPALGWIAIDPHWRGTWH